MSDRVQGKLAGNVVQFAGVLRRAGLTVGSAQLANAVRALQKVDLGNRDDVYWGLHCTMVSRGDQRDLFAHAFELFWNDPFGRDASMAMLLPRAEVQNRSTVQRSRRVLQAMGIHRSRKLDQPPEPELEMDAAGTASSEEVLRSRDFEQMSAEELARARKILENMRFPWQDLPTRRTRVDSRGHRVDLRQTLRHSVGTGGVPIRLAKQSRQYRPPPLVILCDISGSMDRYSRMFLHFAHTLSNSRDRVHAFLFGTRLTHVTRQLQARDIDEALARVGHEVKDWAGGTRIGSCLHDFNWHWGRRVLAQGAVVLLVTDGLEREADGKLASEAKRLRRTCRRLIWLNPLLRWEGFEPLAAGMRALLPHVHELRSVHSLQSLEQLAAMLAPAGGGQVASPRI